MAAIAQTQPRTTPIDPAFHDPPPADSAVLEDAFLKAADEAFKKREQDAQTPIKNPPAKAAEPPKNDDTPQDGEVQAGDEPAPSGRPPEPPAAKPSALEDPFNLSGKTPTAKNWKALKDDRDRWKKAAEDLQAKITDTGASDPEAVAALIKERDELRGVISKALVQEDPQFRAKYEPLERQATELALQAVPAEQHDAFKEIAAMPVGQARRQRLKEMLSELDDVDRSTVIASLNDLDRVRAARNAELDGAKQNWQKIQQDRQLSVQQELKRQQAELEKTLERLSDPEVGAAPFQIIEGNQEHNKAVEEIKTEARRILSGKLTNPEFINAVTLAATAPALIKELQSANKRIEELQSKINAMTNAQPGLDGDLPTVPTGEDGGHYEGLSYGEVIASMAHKTGAFNQRSTR